MCICITCLRDAEGGIPKPDVYSPLDPPDDFFRIRLICNILETCGVFWEKGVARKKLDFFLTFFQVCHKTVHSIVGTNFRIVLHYNEAVDADGY